MEELEVRLKSIEESDEQNIHDNDSDNDSEIDDTKKSSYPLLFFLLGSTGSLFVDVIVSSIDIYMIATGNKNIGLTLTRCLLFPNAAMGMLLCFFKPRNLKPLIIFSMFVLFFALCTLPLFILLNFHAKLLMYSSIPLFILGAMASKCLFFSGYSLSAMISENAIVYDTVGNGISGILTCVLRIVTKASYSKESQLKISASIYFYLDAFIVLITFALYIFYCKTHEEIQKASSITTKENPPNFFSHHTIDVIKLIYPIWISLFLLANVYFSLYPGYITTTRQTPKLGTWTPLIVVIICTFFELIGRLAPRWKIWPSQKYAWIPSVTLLLFYPIFLLSLQNIIKNVEPYWTFIWTMPFALSIGYFLSILMVYGNSMPYNDDDDKKFISYLISFSIDAGEIVAQIISLFLPHAKV